MRSVCDVMIDKTTMIMLTELKDECLRYIKLADQIELEGLPEDQIANISGELAASTVRLNIHSETVNNIIEQ